MDRLFNSHWFVKIISFFIALMLFTIVNMDNISSQPGILPSISTASYTLEEVELTVLYDDEKYAITDQTERVQVNLKGPQSALTLFQVTRPNYEVFVDVTDREEGAHTLSVQHRGFPSELAVSIVPQFVRVELQEKETVSLPVSVDLLNSSEVADGYTVGTPIVTPVNVDITAARDAVSKVASAKAYVDVSGVDKMVEEAVPIKLFDENGNELHLDVEPSTVDVKVPVTSPNKTVPVKITQEGELPEGLSIDTLTIEPEDVTIYGPSDTIEQVDVLEGATLNLDDITKSQTVEVPLPVPPGVERIEPQVVRVKVELSEEETRQWSDVPVEIIGVSEDLDAAFVDGESATTSFTVYGAESLLDKLTLNDIQAFVDVNGRPEGEQELPIQLNGPRNLQFVSNEANKTIIITTRSES